MKEIVLALIPHLPAILGALGTIAGSAAAVRFQLRKLIRAELVPVVERIEQHERRTSRLERQIAA